jgi:hypothetical protein
VWSTELINKITTSSIITVALYAKVITQAVTTRTTTIINTESMMFRVSNIIIIIITITNGYCFIGLASCTLRDRRGTASIQGDFRGLLLPLPNDQWRS